MNVTTPEAPAIPTSVDTAANCVDAVKIYGSGETEVHALDGVSVAFTRGEFSAIMGPSGSGKSTLLQCMAGLDVLTSGSTYVSGENLTTMKDKALTLLRRKRVGFVFQQFNLVPTLTARENIVLPLSLAGTSVDPEWFDAVVAALDLGNRLHHRPTELSGGQQQRVAVARSLITRPDVVFGDEPTGNLDSQSSAALLDFLRAAVDQFGQTMVMVTHDPAAAARADRVLFLRDGKVEGELRSPTVEAILDHMRA
jgi:putative ABC transport system ATP-binding protein